MIRESVTYRELVTGREARGEAKGAERQSRKIAVNMLRAGMAVEQVAAMLELSVAKVQQIQVEIYP